MANEFQQRTGRNWMGALGCFVLAGGAFSLGYWQGQRSIAHSTSHPGALTVKGASFSQQREGLAHPMMPPMTGPAIPADATPEMKEFLQNRAILAKNLALVRSQNTNSVQGPEEMAQFQKQNADLLKRQSELSQILAQQQAQRPIPEPPPLKLPPNATPAMQAFLTTRDQVMRSQVEMMNQHRTDDPKTRQAAMQQWQQQNAALLQQMRDEAQALAKPNKT